jgi:hypothetical protein
MKTNSIVTQCNRSSAACEEAAFVEGKLLRLVHVKGLIVLLAVMAVGTIQSFASDPIGIYALVHKVVLEPSETMPERIQIWGDFALATGHNDQYASPKSGYLYFKLNAEKPEVCRKEWADLKSVAGADQVVGFGNRHAEQGTIRKADAKPEKADVYPLGWGVSKINRKDYKPVSDLLALSQSKAVNKAAPDSKQK